MHLLGFVQGARELRTRAEGIEPRIAHHRGITEKALGDGARQHLERGSFLTEVTELPGEIVQAFRVAEVAFISCSLACRLSSRLASRRARKEVR